MKSGRRSIVNIKLSVIKISELVINPNELTEVNIKLSVIKILTFQLQLIHFLQLISN